MGVDSTIGIVMLKRLESFPCKYGLEVAGRMFMLGTRGAGRGCSGLSTNLLDCVRDKFIFDAELPIHKPLNVTSIFGETWMLRAISVFGLVITAAGLLVNPAYAETPVEVLAALKTEASATPGFQGFSAARGESFFKTKHNHDLSCSSCHTDNPAAQGKHAETDKLIKPLAPAANPERFTDMKKVAKWFKRNCNDVLDRECTPQEKGDVLAYLLTVPKN